MNQITRETRHESYIKTEPETRYAEILNSLDNKEMTSRQIAYALGYSDLNTVRPRLTELEKQGIVKITGKVKDTLSNRSVAIYRRTS